jgi:septal ring factor EnvC (AmiA/AmiB activator)
MGKVLLYASIAVTLAAAAIGFVNKSKLSTTKDELASSQQEGKQKTATIEQAQKSLKETKESLATVTAEKEQVVAQLETVKSAAEKSKSQVADLTTQLGTKDSEITKLTADIQAKEAQIQTLTAAPTEVAAPSPDQQVLIQEKEALITKLQGDLDSSRVQLEDLRKKNADRMALKMRNGLEGRILAVNQAWNFVVLNLGDRNGVVGNAEMLIKRGNQLVGKLRITSVEPSTSIADIVASSVPRGVNIQPGDHVIYQATAE